MQLFWLSSRKGSRVDVMYVEISDTRVTNAPEDLKTREQNQLDLIRNQYVDIAAKQDIRLKYATRDKEIKRIRNIEPTKRENQRQIQQM